MKLFGTEKDSSGRRTYFFGLKVFEEIKRWNTKKTYLLGIKIRKKKETSIDLHKMDLRARMFAAESKILTLGLYYKDLPENERFVLCFDYLAYPFAEAIDAWTFFQYLQTQGIPSKYVIRKENDLFKKLQREGKLKDILPVSNELQVLTDYPNIIAKSRLIISSFGFELSQFFKFLPFCKYIFIEHGVNFLKDWAVKHYSASRFGGILVPTRLTKSAYDENGVDYETCIPYYSGLPRWDKLELTDKNKKVTRRKIFIFFTWRTSFTSNLQLRHEYITRIKSFIKRLVNIFSESNDIEINLSLHHALLERDSGFKGKELFQHVHFVPMSDISSMVREADLCITDYSSISFDFLYRNTPVVFYCFDSDINYPNKNDSIKSTIEKIRKHLYNCCIDEDSAVSLVKYYTDRNFALEPEHIEKNNQIFWFRGGNCERLWQLINKN